ncbi:MAG: D-alanine--D-alanine ligase [Oscillospiraceae bacterium]|nr:D-alanine--D-alanine ligase [Oscillospiraceae bacterium]
MSRIKVAVLFGGVSNEHDISLISAANIISAVPEDKYEVIPIGITKKGRWLYYPGDISCISSGRWESNPDCVPAVILPDPMYKGVLKMPDNTCSLTKVDVVFPALHGQNGEDGAVQGLLKLSGIPYVGCGILSSADCMDKVVTHTILEANGIKMARWNSMMSSELNRLDEICEEIAEKLEYPVFVKPANSGSSVGVNKANSFEELKNAVKLAFSHDKKVIVEEYIKGRELECAVFGRENPFASDVGEIRSCNEFYDYEAKYILGTSGISIPADIPEDVSKTIRETAVKAFKTMGCSGLARVDFFLKEDGSVILNEINTMPGFTQISMYPKLMEHMGISLSELIDKLIMLALDSAQAG